MIGGYVSDKVSWMMVSDRMRTDLNFHGYHSDLPRLYVGVGIPEVEKGCGVFEDILLVEGEEPISPSNRSGIGVFKGIFSFSFPPESVSGSAAVSPARVADLGVISAGLKPNRLAISTPKLYLLVHGIRRSTLRRAFLQRCHLARWLANKGQKYTSVKPNIGLFSCRLL